MFEPADYDISVVSQPNMSVAPPELFLGLMRTAEGYLLLDSNNGFDEINLCFPSFFFVFLNIFITKSVMFNTVLKTYESKQSN